MNEQYLSPPNQSTSTNQSTSNQDFKDFLSDKKVGNYTDTKPFLSKSHSHKVSMKIADSNESLAMMLQNIHAQKKFAQYQVKQQPNVQLNCYTETHQKHPEKDQLVTLLMNFQSLNSQQSQEDCQIVPQSSDRLHKEFALCKTGPYQMRKLYQTPIKGRASASHHSLINKIWNNSDSLPTHKESKQYSNTKISPEKSFQLITKFQRILNKRNCFLRWKQLITKSRIIVGGLNFNSCHLIHSQQNNYKSSSGRSFSHLIVRSNKLITKIQTSINRIQLRDCWSHIIDSNRIQLQKKIKLNRLIDLINSKQIHILNQSFVHVRDAKQILHNVNKFPLLSESLLKLLEQSPPRSETIGFYSTLCQDLLSNSNLVISCLITDRNHQSIMLKHGEEVTIEKDFVFNFGKKLIINQHKFDSPRKEQHELNEKRANKQELDKLKLIQTHSTSHEDSSPEPTDVKQKEKISAWQLVKTKRSMMNLKAVSALRSNKCLSYQDTIMTNQQKSNDFFMTIENETQQKQLGSLYKAVFPNQDQIKQTHAKEQQGIQDVQLQQQIQTFHQQISKKRMSMLHFDRRMENHMKKPQRKISLKTQILESIDKISHLTLFLSVLLLFLVIMSLIQFD